MKKRILVAEDDPMFQELLLDLLESAGYSVVLAKNGKEGIEKFRSEKALDLAILDVMMPIFSGWEVLSTIKTESDLPVIMLTALGDETHEIKGLKIGANDYIAKPFSMGVFLARIENQLNKKKSSEILKFEDLVIDRNNQRVYIGEEEIHLNRKEFHLLDYLASNYSLLLSREKILSNVWGDDFDGDWRTIDTHIKTLRSKLGEKGNYIKTGRGVGYLFEVKDDK